MFVKEKYAYNLVVHSITSDDYVHVSELYATSIKNNAKGFIQDFDYHGPIIKQYRRFKNDGGDLLIAKHNNQVVGMGALKPISKLRVELCKLHVHPNYQGYGFGKDLTRHLMKRAKELSFNIIELNVTKTQKAAIRLYHKLGFKEINSVLHKINVGGEIVSFDTIDMEKVI
ncbi:MAG: GNAT family N-acetyltransferase [Pseudomonadota bacterium]